MGRTVDLMGLDPAAVSSRHYAEATSEVAEEVAQLNAVRPALGHARQAAALVSNNNRVHVLSNALIVKRLAITPVTVAIAQAVASDKYKGALETGGSAAPKAARTRTSCIEYRLSTPPPARLHRGGG